MGPFALGMLLALGWLAWKGRLKRMDRNDWFAILIGMLGVVLAASGKAVIGGVLLAGSMGFMWARPRKPKVAPKPLTDSAVRDAQALLGVAPDADAAAIRAAHRRLIALAHPDKGGTAALSAQINDARDLLLRHLAVEKKV